MSLLYAATYLSVTGLGFFLAPDLTLRLFFSNGHYDNIFIRIAGAFLIVLSVFVIQVFRLRLEILYTTLIGVRIFLLAVWIYIYLITKDPLFIGFFAVVGLGEVLSISALISDRKEIPNKTNL